MKAEAKQAAAAPAKKDEKAALNKEAKAPAAPKAEAKIQLA